MPSKSKKPKRPAKRKPQAVTYTHKDASGMPWRFVGSRPVSALADKTMADCGLAYYGPERQIGVARRKR